MKEWKIYFWRTRDGEELDFLIEIENGKFIGFEVKITPPTSLAKMPKELNKVVGEVPIKFIGVAQTPLHLSISQLSKHLLTL